MKSRGTLCHVPLLLLLLLRLLLTVPTYNPVQAFKRDIKSPLHPYRLPAVSVKFHQQGSPFSMSKIRGQECASHERYKDRSIDRRSRKFIPDRDTIICKQADASCITW